MMTEWEAINHHLQHSDNELERRHFYLGRSLTSWGAVPILLDKHILYGHGYVRGATEARKTSIGIAPLLVRLIRQAEEAILVVDLKGDDALLGQVRDECQRSGRTLKLFTNAINRATHVFNPFLDANVAELSINQIAETFLEALNVSWGEAYGKSYFSRVARQWLSFVLHQYPNIDSFARLHELREKGPRNRDNFELLSVIESMASFPQLNMRPGARQHTPQVMEASVHFPRVLDEKQVVYFYLPATREQATVREMARLAIFSLLNAHNSRPKSKPKVRSFVFIDEFGRVASEGFKAMLETSRSLGMSFVLSNQSFASLNTGDVDLRPVVAQNTRFKQIFSEREPEEIDRLCRASGEPIADRNWWLAAFGPRVFRATTVPAVENSWVTEGRPGTRLTIDQMITVNDDPFASIVSIEGGSGYSQFAGFSVPITMGGYTISEETYKRYEAMPWPAQSSETITVTRRPPTPTEVGARRSHIGTEDMDPVLFEDEDTEAPKKPKPRRGRPRKKE